MIISEFLFSVSLAKTTKKVQDAEISLEPSKQLTNRIDKLMLSVNQVMIFDDPLFIKIFFVLVHEEQLMEIIGETELFPLLLSCAAVFALRIKDSLSALTIRCTRFCPRFR